MPSPRLAHRFRPSHPRGDRLRIEELDRRDVPSTVTVTTTADVVNGDTSSLAALAANNGGDGISLREAIAAANNTPGADTIILPAGTYVLKGGQLNITDGLTIAGADPRTTVIDGNAAGRVFHVTNSSAESLLQLTIRNGKSVQGGAILVDGGSTLTMTDAVVTGNTAPNDVGGGIYVTQATLNLNRVTLSNNSAKWGGAIYFGSAVGGTLVNVTVSGNKASATGGGIFTDSPITLRDCTITLNQGTNGGGGLSVQYATVTISNSIVAGNSANGQNKDVSGSFSSDGHNLIQVAGNATGFTTGDITGQSPGLQSLANYGGLVPTHALSAGSPAVNAGNPAGAPTTDARGYGRFGAPDIGAFELNGTTSAKLLLATNSTVNNSNTPGLPSWTGGTVVGVGDPNFALGSGTTNGNFSSFFNLNQFTASNVTLDALDYVHSTITVGGGANTFTLQPGDLLLSIGQNGQTLTSLNSITVNQGDVFVFRPQAPGDYTAGSFFLLLNAPGGATDTWAIDLVEADTMVGDTVVRKGSFLYVASGDPQKDQIGVFTPAGVGPGTTTGTTSVLIDGKADLNFGPAIRAVDLVETATTVGGVTVPAGSLILSVDGGAKVGTNQLPVNQFDAFVLTPTRTMLGSGQDVANASMLFEGSDVGMNGGEEAIRGFTLVIPVPPDRPPVAKPDSYPASENNPLSVPAATGLLFNDTDPDGDALRVTSYTQPAHGTVNVNPDGSFTYAPASQYTGADSFTYTVSDGRGGTATATVTLAVNAVAAPGVTITGDSFLVAADNKIYRVNSSTGTVIATYTTNLANDGVAVAPNGNIYFADYANNRIRYYSPTGTLINDFSTSGQTPQGLAFGPDGNLYVTTTASTVERYRPDGSNHTTFIAAGSGGLNNAKGIVWGPDGNAYVSSYWNSEVLKYNGVTGAFMSVFATGTGGFEDLTFGPDGNLYVASYGDNAVYRYRGSDGAALGAFATGLTTAYGLRFDPNGDLQVSSRSNGQVRTYSSSGTYLGNLDTGLPNPAYIASTSSLVTTSAGGTATFRVVLNTQPTDTVTIALTSSAPAQGSLSTTTLTFTPGNWNVPQVVTVTGLDDGIANGDQTYQITATAASNDPNYNGIAVASVPVLNREVAAPNRPPVATADGYSTNENTPLTVPAAAGLLFNDTDPDGNPLRVTAHTNPANGSVAVNADGSFTYTPNANFYGTDTFRYTVSDGRGGTATATVTLTVPHVNQRPTAVDDRYTLGGLRATLTVIAPGMLGNDSDVDGDPLRVTAHTNPSNGIVTVNADGSFTYTANPLFFSGTDTFTYTVSDGQLSATATVTIDVQLTGNQAPRAAGESYNTPEDSPLTVSAPGVLGNDSDPDGDTLQAILDADAAHGHVNLSSDGSFTYTPNPGYVGADSFTYHATDGSLSSNTVTVSLTVTAVNHPPVAADDPATTPEGQAVTVAVLGNDSDPDGDPLAVTAVGTPGHGTATTDGTTVTYTPTGTWSGTDAFTYTISDGHGGTATATVSVTITPVNHPPVATDGSITTLEDIQGGGRLAATDPDGDPLTFAVVTGPAHGTLTNFDPATGEFTYTPAANYNGPDSFTFQANDGSLDSNTATMSIVVTPVNDPPAAVDDSYSTGQNAPLTIGPAAGVLANDSDVDGDPLKVTGHTNPAHGTLTMNADGSFTYTPTPAFRGTDSFTYTVSDPSGATATATVQIQVIPPNGNPVATDDNYAVDEDATLTIGPPGVLANDTPPGNLPLTARLVSGPKHGRLTFHADGSFTYKPDSDYSGPDSFVYRAVDVNGHASAAAHVTIQVRFDEPAPVALPDDFVVDAGTTLRTAAPGVLANDTDTDNDPRAILVTGPAHGTLTLNRDGSFVYAPAAGFTGADTFAYRATDGPMASAPVTVTITVNPTTNPTPTPTGTSEPPQSGSVGGTGTAGNPAVPPTVTPGGTPTGSGSGSASDGKGTVAPPVLPLPPVVGPTGFTFGVGIPSATGFGAPDLGPARPVEVGPTPAVALPPVPAVPTLPPVPAVIPPMHVDAPAVAGVGVPVGPVVESVVPPVPMLGADNSVFTGLNELTQDVSKPKRVEVAAGTAVGTGVALTAGTVLLSPRLAYWFLSALLARRTVWKPFDPLEVVYAWEKNRPAGGTDEEEDSLAGMVG